MNDDEPFFNDRQGMTECPTCGQYAVEIGACAICSGLWCKECIFTHVCVVPVLQEGI